MAKYNTDTAPKNMLAAINQCVENIATSIAINVGCEPGEGVLLALRVLELPEGFASTDVYLNVEHRVQHYPEGEPD